MVARIGKIIGPPGCGKTTYLQRQMSIAAEKYGPKNIIACSFSRASAYEIAARVRDIDFEHGQIGTMHSLARQVLGGKDVAIAELHLKEWREAQPLYAMTDDTSRDRDEPEYELNYLNEGSGDKLLRAYNMLRNQLVARDTWPSSVEMFARAWEAWKSTHGYLDFTDLITHAISDVQAAPRNARVLIADEVQDFNPLQWELVKHWLHFVEVALLAGDDDQTIFKHTGARAEAFIDFAAEHQTVLAQSYRVPASVQRVALAWIGNVSKRLDKDYHARHVTPDDLNSPIAQGVVRALKGTIAHPDAVLDDVEQQIAQGRSVMLIASCSYMLKALTHALRERALPFHNPYRRDNGAWNPLGGNGRGVSMRERVLSFLCLQDDFWYNDDAREHVNLAHEPTGRDLKNIAALLQADCFAHDGRENVGKKLLDTIDDLSAPSIERVQAYLSDEFYDALFEGDLDWLTEHTLGAKKAALLYPISVAKAHGRTALRETPKIIIGTIHSVKGGEADVVYVFPDLSKSGVQEWMRRGAGRDAIVRAFYVALTRAREELVVCESASAMRVNLPLAAAVEKAA